MRISHIRSISSTAAAAFVVTTLALGALAIPAASATAIATGSTSAATESAGTVPAATSPMLMAPASTETVTPAPVGAAPASVAPVTTAAASSAPAGATITNDLVAAADGSGTACTGAAPCSITAAMSLAKPGATVRMLAGDHGALMLRGPGGTAAQPIMVTADAGVTVQRLETHVPHVTFIGQRITVVLYVHLAAVGTVVDSAHLDGAGAFVRSNDVVIRNSLFENGTAIDGVQIKDSRRVTFVDNTVRNYSSIPGNSVHVDCVQIFDSHDVTIERNTLSNCSNAAIILSDGRGLGSSGIRILSNFIQGCTVVSSGCVGGSALDARELAFVGTVISNNTIATSPTRVAATEGLVFDRNIVAYFFECDAPMTNTIVIASRYNSCAWQVGVNGNRMGTVEFVDEANGDLRLVSVGDAQLAPIGEPGAELDVDGHPTNPAVAGAHSPLEIALVVGPRGTGATCTSIEPCSLESALSQATPGTTIELQGGSYAQRSVTAPGGSASEPVIVRPANGASVTIAKLTTAVPHVVWQSINFTAGLATTTAAVGTIIDGAAFSGAGVYIVASDAVVRGSSFVNGPGDAIHVRTSSRATIEGNTVTGFKGDGIQVTGGVDHTVRGNTVGDTANGMIIDGQARRVAVVDNRVTGTATVALDVRTASEVTVAGNELLAGSTRLGANSATGGTIAYLSECDAVLVGTVVLAWNTGLCALPKSLAGGPVTPAEEVFKADAVLPPTPEPAEAPAADEVTSASGNSSDVDALNAGPSHDAEPVSDAVSDAAG